MSSFSTGTSDTATVDLGEDYGDISLFGWTKDDSVEVKYSVAVTPIAASTGYPTVASTGLPNTTAATPSWTGVISAAKMPKVRVQLVAALSASVTLALAL